MSAFPIDAALEGFRFTRAHPRAILPWAALSFVAGLVGAAILIGSGAQTALGALAQLKVDPTDPATVTPYLQALGAAAPGLALKAVLDFLVFAVLSCSAFRAIFERDGRAKLAFGREELRMMALLLVLVLLNFMILTIMSGVTGALTLIAGGPESAGGRVAFLLGQVASFALQAIVMVRLALASPMCVADGRWSLAESWRRTRGRFWPMLGAFVMAALLYMLVAFLVTQLITPLAALMRGLSAAPRAGLAQLVDPAVLVVQLGIALALGLGVPILAGPLAAAYRKFR